MRTSLTGTFLLLALSLAAPGGAQIAGRHDHGPAPATDPFLGSGRLPGPSLADDLRHVHRRIDRARAGGLLSRGEARRLRREARSIGRLSSLYGRGGLSDAEASELRNRTRALDEAVTRPPR